MTTQPPPKPIAVHEPRYIRLGVSQPSGDPAQHRVFDLRATYDVEADGWIGWVSEQNLNDQQGEWQRAHAGRKSGRPFPTAAACLGAAVTSLVAAVDPNAIFGAINEA